MGFFCFYNYHSIYCSLKLSYDSFREQLYNIFMKIKRNQAFSNKLLKVIVVGGVVTIAAINPFFGLLTAKVIEEELKKKKWKELRRGLYSLKRRGFIDVEQHAGGSYSVRATNVGKLQAEKYDLDNIFIKMPKRWDRQWRMVIFDIPAEKQKGRLALLAKLRKLGFIMLQKSIWAHPFECQDEVAVLARAFEVDKYVQHLVCSGVSAGEYLKREFEKRNNTKLL